MITATDLEVRAGARTLLFAEGPALRIQPGDRIGLVGRNGAGKTTTMRILAGDSEPYAGTITRTGEIGYLPQDPREGDLDILARDRVLSARGLDTLLADLRTRYDIAASHVVGHSVNLEQPIVDAVGLALPFAPLCTPDCPGLCPQCGVPLATAEPGHGHEQIDPRWAKLAGLLPPDGSEASPS